MADYYGMDGNPITLEQWGRLFESRERVVAQTTLPGGCWVSTVLMGIDHNFTDPGNPPIIFESMVFESEESEADLDCVRYATREQAQAGHSVLVTRWTGWTPGDPLPEGTAASFLTQFIHLLNAAMEDDPITDEDSLRKDGMSVMFPKDAEWKGEGWVW